MTHANFFLVGAAKAGTTSLASFLEGLPDVFISPIKEPCHFCTDTNLQLHDEMKRQQVLDTDKYFAQGMQFPMHIAHVPDPEHYDMLFAQAKNAIVIGECTTYYLPSKVAAEGIHAYNPDAKIIAVLRDPASRIKSHYRMAHRTGLERRSLEECLQEEIALGEAANFSNCRMYLAMSDYTEQVARYVRLFGAEQVCIVHFEDLKSNSETTLRNVLSFLGLPTENIELTLPRENVGDFEPRFKALDRLLYKSGIKRALRYYLRKFLPREALKTLKAKYSGKKVTHMVETADLALDIEEVRKLAEKYTALRTQENRS